MPATSTKKYELLLIAVIAARATSFIFSKMILESLTPFNLLAVRFIIAFILLALIFNKTVRSLTRRDWLAGLAIGTAFFVTMACEMIALTQAASSLVSLLENCAIIFVPLFELLLFKKFPAKITVISTGLAMLGVVLLALSQGGLSGGFTWGLLAGMCYAGAIIITQRLSQNSSETLGIGIVQIGTMGVLSLLSVLALARHRHCANRHYGRAFAAFRARAGTAAAAANRCAVVNAGAVNYRLHRLWLYLAAHGAKPRHRRPRGIILRRQPCHSDASGRNRA